MKYGRLIHIGFAKKDGSTEKRLISVGDVFECLALERVYERMGIKKEEIIDCYQYDVETYTGEYIVLPINIYSLNVRYSRRILPVFLGLTVGGQHDLADEEWNTLARFSPVGCRDERTMRRLIEKGIDAYLQGCLVATFPKRISNPDTQKKVFFVDPEAGIKEYIPSHLLQDYEFFSHDFYTTPDKMTNGADIYAFGKNIIDMYSNYAKMIVTSKYHAALIALALGIPVVLVMESCYYKYTWIKKYIPVYEPKDYPNIDWNPPAVAIPDYEKNLMLNIACNRIKETYNKYSQICTLSEIREDITCNDFQDIFYGTYAIDYINTHWDKNTEIEYAMWGATQTALTLYNYISEHFPKAHLVKIYDFAIRDEFLGMLPDNPEKIKTDPDYFILVTGNSASNAAKELFASINKSPDQYFCCERKVLTKEELNDYV